MRVHFHTIDEQHHSSWLEICVPIQSKYVGVVLLFLKEKAQFALSYIYIKAISLRNAIHTLKKSTK